MSQSRLVILARSDSYEGFERPTLNDELAPDAAELMDRHDVAALRALLTDLAGQGVDDFDLMAFGDQRGSAWEFIGYDVAAPDGRSAIVHRTGEDFEHLISLHGLFWNYEDAQAFLAASGGAELVPVFRYRRTGLRPDQALWYTIGNEFSPGDPFGRIVLTIDAHGHAALEHYWMQGNGAWTGDVPTGVLDDLRAALSRGGFPHVPSHQPPPGATFRQVELFVDGRPEYAMVEERFGRELDGFDEAFAILDSLAIQLSGGAYRGGQDTLPPSVTNVQRA